MRGQRAVFLDWDGVLNKPCIRANKAYAPLSFDHFEIFPEVPAVVKRLTSSGFIVAVVSNQPELSRGNLATSALDAMHKYLGRAIPVAGIYVCPHDEGDGCNCRKPLSGLLVRAARELNLDLTQSFMIGDTWRDIGAGSNAGCQTVLIDRPYSGQTDPTWRARDLTHAADIVLSHVRKLNTASPMDSRCP